MEEDFLDEYDIRHLPAADGHPARDYLVPKAELGIQVVYAKPKAIDSWCSLMDREDKRRGAWGWTGIGLVAFCFVTSGFFSKKLAVSEDTFFSVFIVLITLGVFFALWTSGARWRRIKLELQSLVPELGADVDPIADVYVPGMHRDYADQQHVLLPYPEDV